MAAGYEQFKKEELLQEASRRGIQMPSDANKADLAKALAENDGENSGGPLVYSFPSYEPTPEEEDRDLLMGLEIALGSLRGSKVASGGNPQYNPAIGSLEADVSSVKRRLGLEE